MAIHEAGRLERQRRVPRRRQGLLNSQRSGENVLAMADPGAPNAQKPLADDAPGGEFPASVISSEPPRAVPAGDSTGAKATAPGSRELRRILSRV